ncbi:SRPBCC family protein [Flavihumibacter petaseus]|uniref:AraC effector-binding domain-containing protein n=1 Tax=Flavihumibacter petaseus NBRC 106054 TaxID=1220578 RepID=A0A0E9N7J6_9BACT|nr:SRPBCC family protein [Flavihumibacter petaseus]GAO45330.1 hypothetical protein FPE01S_05_00270 [Flavihumibacter petaseus NBRC 106054]
MKKLLKILGWILGILVLLLLAGYLLPAKVSVSRGIAIQAQPEKIYNVLTNMKTYNSWMVWNQRDTAMRIEWGDRTSGLGASYKWFSDNSQVGDGQLKISDVQPYKSITTEMTFGESPNPSFATWWLQPDGKGTSVKWEMTMNMGMNPVGRWMGLLMRGMMEKDFDNGLSQLKQKIESGQLGKQDPKVTLEESKVDAMRLLTILDTAQAMTEIGPLLQKAYGEMNGLMLEQKLSISQAPMAWYYTEGEPFIVDAAIAVSGKPATTSGRIRFREEPASKVIIAHYYGPYEEMKAGYDKLAGWLQSNNKKAAGKPYEVYVDDPTGKSMYDVRTDIIQPFE